MQAQGNAAPIIIKRKKIIKGGGHHGGAWKVAYADFVTAMMAFFMLMWLLNATTEQQRKGIADYFTPTIPINRVSGGGNGAFGGESIFSEQVLPKNGTGATNAHAPVERNARGETGLDSEGSAEQMTDEVLTSLEEMLRGRGGESAVMENALRHIVTRITDEGLVIELFELDGIPLFDARTDKPTQLLRDLTALIAATARTVVNPIAIGGHVRAEPIVIAREGVWDLSLAQASVVRELLQNKGVDARRVHRVTGHADRRPALPDPMAQRNNRIEIVLLRDVPRN
ncbi:OmpA/MotB family protein [Sulfitobacter aestuariivivens]|uniref:Flagellar motor protein MotB n=1 Tax=Sulfitobacter aestuariivivens TaxID=2766981 RepID=A0A927HGJ3_9RHOB|nr:flagellar motor protein MotB [Sulfitobacter aestuariivivens]MBD3665529.1 flagellar motor protein MotB [Sulfitobacter aestuariivivens]